MVRVVLTVRVVAATPPEPSPSVVRVERKDSVVVKVPTVAVVVTTLGSEMVVASDSVVVEVVAGRGVMGVTVMGSGELVVADDSVVVVEIKERVPCSWAYFWGGKGFMLAGRRSCFVSLITV